MSDLSPEARALIEASRGEDEPSMDDRARVGRKLADQLPAFAASAALAKIELDAARVAAQGKLAAGTSGLFGSGLVKVASLSVAAMLAGTAAVVLVRDRERPEPAAPVSVPVTSPASPPSPATALSPVVEIAPRERPARRAAHVERTPTPRQRMEPAAAPTAAERRAELIEEAEPAEEAGAPRIEARADDRPAREAPGPIEIEPPLARAPARVPRGPDQGAKLLAAAREAFESGDPERTLELTERHAAAYPKSTLAEERIALRGLAFCALQRFDDGLRALRAARGAQSPLHAAALRACKSARPAR